MQLLVNGQSQSQVSVQDRGLAYGDGLFETIAISAGKVQFWPQHWQRLALGLERLAFSCDIAQLKCALEADIKALIVANDLPQSVLKVTITRGTGGRGYLPPADTQATRIVQLSPWPAGREHLAASGIHVRLCQHPWGDNKALAGLKHLNRLDQVIARQEWHDETIHEGIMLNQQGCVQSGVMSNVFVEAEGQIYTPNNDTAGINGIMAGQVQLLAEQLGITVSKQPLSLAMLEQADAVFLTNSLNGIWPVVKFAKLDYAIGPLTQRLQDALALHIQAHSQAIA